MNEFKWPVVPICEKQLRDIPKSDLYDDGLFRKCDIYKGGGGYDQFSLIVRRRFEREAKKQFVVQLRGCPYSCHYCYVTTYGVWGDAVELSSGYIVERFIESRLTAFHLMGGAPALYLKHWPALIEQLPADTIFHSDFLLMEDSYDFDTLRKVSGDNKLYAVSIKGFGEDEFFNNTGAHFNEPLFHENLSKLLLANINFYFTYTGMSVTNIEKFKDMISQEYGCSLLTDSFSIAIRHYKALD